MNASAVECITGLVRKFVKLLELIFNRALVRG